MVAAGEQSERLAALALVQVAHGRLLRQVEGAHERHLRRDGALGGEGSRDEHQHHEDHVDDGDGRLEEVVVVGRDELAELVDEEPEADAGDERRELPPEAALHRHEEDQGDEHAQAAPEQVGEVDLAAAQLRPPCGRQGGAYEQHGGDGDDEEGLDVVVRCEAAHEQ